MTSESVKAVGAAAAASANSSCITYTEAQNREKEEEKEEKEKEEEQQQWLRSLEPVTIETSERTSDVDNDGADELLMTSTLCVLRSELISRACACALARVSKRNFCKFVQLCVSAAAPATTATTAAAAAAAACASIAVEHICKLYRSRERTHRVISLFDGLLTFSEVSHSPVVVTRRRMRRAACNRLKSSSSTDLLFFTITSEPDCGDPSGVSRP